jgi:hypothetical protein
MLTDSALEDACADALALVSSPALAAAHPAARITAWQVLKLARGQRTDCDVLRAHQRVVEYGAATWGWLVDAALARDDTPEDAA